MNAAIIVMTILGCNDSATDCHYIATAEQRWTSIEMCDAVSEQRLPSYANQPYPVIVAVCQDTQVAGLAETTAPKQNAEASEAPPRQPAEMPSVTTAQAETLASRAMQRVRNVLPSTEGIKTLMVKPVRMVENGYSWVARKFD